MGAYQCFEWASPEFKSMEESTMNWIKQYSGKILRSDEMTLYIFDWSKLSEDEQALLVENKLYALHEKFLEEGRKTGEVLDTKIIPFALLNPEEGLEPEELAEFDTQCDGVLLKQGKKIIRCAETYSTTLEPYSDSLEELAIGVMSV